MKTATIVIVLILIVTALLVFMPSFIQNTKKPSVSPPSTSSSQNKIPPNIPTPTPVELSSARGIITALNQNQITIKTAAESVTLTITNTKDFQKITAGNLDKGNATFTNAKASDLKLSQEVMVAIDKGTNNASTIIIL